ncbi:uncharacterized protein [Triticum aestivum]|uniref:uncharacterized protein isoform X2 n=1 Tax=Triticum aestivum TaxID=4565 RepID=UPI001D0302D7|nr:uncharacterized protein LOC123160655 isoform X2 [Triticum aestivum]
MTQIGFGFVIVFTSLSGVGAGVRHVVSLPGAKLLLFCMWRSSFPFTAGVAMTSFPLLIWVRRVSVLVPFQRKQVAALVPTLRRHGVVDLFSGRGVWCSVLFCCVFGACLAASSSGSDLLLLISSASASISLGGGCELRRLHKKIQYTEDGCQQELDGAVVKNTTDILTL